MTAFNRRHIGEASDAYQAAKTSDPNDQYGQRSSRAWYVAELMPQVLAELDRVNARLNHDCHWGWREKRKACAAEARAERLEAQLAELQRRVDALETEKTQLRPTVRGDELRVDGLTAQEWLQIPEPRGYTCPACGHGTTVHRIHGCDVRGCDCPAPMGRIRPADAAPTGGAP